MTTHVRNSIVIARDSAAIFDYAATPAYWPQWHPSSLRLYGDTAHPLEQGARFEEDVRAGGRNGHLSWRVLASARPLRWVAEATVNNGASLTLSYTLAWHARGCEFTRDLHYALPNWWLRMLNVLVLRRRIEAESHESLLRLKAVLESSPVLSSPNP